MPDGGNLSIISVLCCQLVHFDRQDPVFSSSGRSPGRAIILPQASASALAAASALAKSLTLKFFM